MHGARELGDGGVGMLAIQHILAIGQRLEQTGFIKEVRSFQGFFLVTCGAGDFCDLIQRVVHAAIFGAEHIDAGMRRLPVDDPLGEINRCRLRRLTGLIIGCVHVGVHHALLDLMQIVERHDQTVFAVRHRVYLEGRKESRVR